MISDVRINTTEVDKKLAKLKTSLSFQHKLGQQILKWYFGEFSNIFAREGEYKGHERWKDLQPKTWDWKGKKGYTKILQNTRTLFSSYTQFVLPTEENKIFFGSQLEYAAVHNYGYPPKNIPAREHLFVTPQMETELAGLINLWTQQEINQ